MLALHIFKTNGIGNNWKGVAQAEAVIFFILVAALALLQLRATRHEGGAAVMQRPLRKKKRDIGGIVLTVLFSLVCILYVMPIVEVLINSFKTHSAINTDTFALPNAGTFAGTSNYVKGMTFGNYPFLKSLLYSIVITILSVTLILLCTSMPHGSSPASAAVLPPVLSGLRVLR